MKLLSSCLVRTALAVSLLLMAAGAHAQIPQTMNYQVMLTDDADQPLAGHSVQLVFRIYNVNMGGGSLWTETHNVVTNSIGVVSVVLGSTTPLAIDFDGPLWLQVEVDSEVLSPRRELTSAPYSLSGGSGGGDGHSLDASDGSPVDALYVDANGDVGIGTTSPQAELHVREELQVGSTATLGGLMVHGGSTGTGGVLVQGDGYDGGYLNLIHGNGTPFATLGRSTGSGGGKLWLGKDTAGSNGVWVDANYMGTGSARMDMNGASEQIRFDLSQSGDSSVLLPVGSINSYEITDEPGVASAVYDGSTSFSGFRQNMDVRSITAPTNGYILAVGTAELALYHTYNTSYNVTSVQVGLTDDSSYIPPSQDTVVQVPDRAGTGSYRQVVTVHGVFPAYAGLTKTIRMYAWRTLGSAGYYRNVHITLLFIPTARGTVETISAAAAGEPSLEGDSASALGDIEEFSTSPTADAEAGPSVSVSEDLLRELMSRVEQLEQQAASR